MIALADAKAHLNITDDADDALITSKINVASAWVAAYTGADYTPVVTTNTDGSTSTIDPTPAPVNEACLQLVAHLYANREASLVGVTAQALPMGFLDLLMPYRAWSFGS